MNITLLPFPWPEPPPIRVLEPGWVHIYRLNLDLGDAFLPERWACLSQEEVQKAARFRTDDLSRRYKNTHSQLRHILASYLKMLPSEIRFSTGAHGKPSLEKTSDVRFNLSHSSETGLVAICRGQEVGIDIEHWRENVDRRALARRFFSPGEAEQISAYPDEKQAGAFFACWTRKEAYIKGLGGGLSIPLDSFEVSVASGNPVRLHNLAFGREPVPGWSIFDLNAGAGFSAAVAVEGCIHGICCWTWKG